jgi:hypothetical protein
MADNTNSLSIEKGKLSNKMILPCQSILMNHSKSLLYLLMDIIKDIFN